MLVKSHPLLVGPQIDAVTIEISVENFPEDKVNLQKDPLIPTPWHLPTGLYILLSTYLLTSVYYSYIHNGKETEAT